MQQELNFAYGYIHYHAHRRNLVLAECVYNVDAATDFLETLQMLHKFSSGSVVHDLFLNKQEELESVGQHLEETPPGRTGTTPYVVKNSPSSYGQAAQRCSQKNVKQRTELKAISARMDEKFVLYLNLCKYF
ncbi:hypothetical protein CHARACLAT_032578 [Characodon lateralis]|uniref:Uncharacterized protein n=1 Tax=Characodon lateralis TaxID=208331 RepID=A0ABU7DW26_9TELE|nr:hypothetical protein [Characodon lateralis]